MVRGGPDLTRDKSEERLERWISYILIAGVIASLILEVAGMVLYVRAAGSAAISHRPAAFVHGSNFFAFLAAILYDAATHPGGFHLMLLGISLLILTPYLRALLSVLYFASKKDIAYFFITLFVLFVLTMSLLFH